MYEVSGSPTKAFGDDEAGLPIIGLFKRLAIANLPNNPNQALDVMSELVIALWVHPRLNLPETRKLSSIRA